MRQSTIWYEWLFRRKRRTRPSYLNCPLAQFDVVTPPPSRAGTPAPERTATPLLDERGPKTQLILLNRRSSLPSVSLSPSIFRPLLNRLAGEVAPGTVVTETEASNDNSVLQAKGRGPRLHDEKHELSSTPLLLLFFNFRLSHCFRSRLYIIEHAPSSWLYYCYILYSCIIFPSVNLCILFVAGL